MKDEYFESLLCTINASFLFGESSSEIKSLSPEVSIGSYVIDPYGEGGCKPIVVFCNMTEKNRPVISHDSENRTLAKGNSSPGSYESAVHYSGVSSSCISQLANLTAISSHCEQFIKYECYGTVLLYNGDPYGWWVSRDHEKIGVVQDPGIRTSVHAE